MPPKGKTPVDNADSCNCRRSSSRSTRSWRLAEHSMTTCGMCSSVLLRVAMARWLRESPPREVHHCRGAADGEGRDRPVEQHLAGRAFGRAGNGDERAYLEAPLTGVAIGVRIAVGQQSVAPVGGPALQEVAIPRFVYLARIRRCRPMRQSAGADQRHALRNLVTGPAQGAAELIRAGERREWRSLAI